MKYIILLAALLAFAGYMLYGKGKQGAGKKNQKTAQDFINVVDIQDGVIYTRDHTLIGFLEVSGRKTDLLSRREQQGLIDQLTAEVSTIQTEWQILAVSQPDDNSALVTQYQDMLDQTQDAVRKKLLREAIRYQQQLLLSGENMERQFYIKVWMPEADGAGQELQNTLQQFCRCFDIAGYRCSIAGSEAVIRLCNMIHNPAAALYEPEDIQTGIPRLTL